MLEKRQEVSYQNSALGFPRRSFLCERDGKPSLVPAYLTIVQAMTISLGCDLRRTSSERPFPIARGLLLHQRGFAALRCYQRRNALAARSFGLRERRQPVRTFHLSSTEVG